MIMKIMITNISIHTLDLLFLNCLSAAKSSGRMLAGVMLPESPCRDDTPPPAEAEMKDCGQTKRHADIHEKVRP